MEALMLSLCVIMPASLEMNKTQAKNICKYDKLIASEAIKNNKVTRFIKDYAAKNKDVIDMGIRKGFLTKEQAINDLGMKNEYR